MEKWVVKYVTVSVKRPGLILVIALATAVAAGLSARSLRLSTSFTRLLPKDTPSVRTARQAQRRVGSTDLLVVAIQSKSPQKNVAFAEALGKELRKMKDLGSVLWKIDRSFFTKNGLLYLDLADLEALRDAIRRLLAEKTQEGMGLLVALDENEEETGPCSPAADNPVSSLIRRFRQRGSPGSVGFYQAKKLQASNVKGYLTSPDGSIAVVVAKPTGEALSIGYVRRLVQRVWKKVEVVRKAHPELAGLKVEFGGAYRNRVNEYDAILRDVVKSGATSGLLILLVVVLMFRRLRPLLLILIPLAIGILWTLGIVSLTSLRQLNIISAFIVGILLGLGIDFGVHLSARYLQERAEGKDLLDALMATSMKTGRALLASALTTAAALFILALSRFKGFSEFGIIAGLGVLLSLAAFQLLFPPLAAILEKVYSPRQWHPFLALAGDTNGRGLRFPWAAATVLVGAVLFTGLSAWWSRDLKFEYNFRNLSAKVKTHKATIKYGKAMGNRASPSVALAPDRQAAHEFYEMLERRTKTPVGDAMIQDFMALDMLVPDHQEEKLRVIGEIRRLLTKARDALKGEKRRDIDKALEATNLHPIRIQDMPDWILDLFTERDGARKGQTGRGIRNRTKRPVGRFLYVYTKVHTWHAAEIREFQKAYQRVRVPSGKVVRLASSSFVLSDVIEAVKQDTVRMVLASAFLVLLVLLVDVRHPLKALLVFTPLAAGFLWTAGIMAATYEKLSLYNMVVLSTILGSGIDASVHLYHSFVEQGMDKARQVVARTGLAVTTASVTTAVGFAGMILSHHGGLASIGKLALVGIMACLAAALTILPSAMILADWMHRRKNRKEAPSHPEQEESVP